MDARSDPLNDGGTSMPAAHDDAPAIDPAPASTERVDVLGVIPVIAESVEVGRRVVEGAVRLRKQVVRSAVDVDEPSVEERVTVERIPIDRPLAEPIGIRYDGDVMVVPVVQERLVVEKRLVLVEEIRIRRERYEQRAPRQVEILREQVVVERFDPRTDQWSSVDVPPAVTDLDASREAAAPATDAREESPAPQAGAFPSGPANYASR